MPSMGLSIDSTFTRIPCFLLNYAVMFLFHRVTELFYEIDEIICFLNYFMLLERKGGKEDPPTSLCHLHQLKN